MGLVTIKSTVPAAPAGLVAVTVVPVAVTLVAETPPKVTLTQPSEPPEIVTTVPPETKPVDGLIEVIVGGLLPLQDASAFPVTNKAKVSTEKSKISRVCFMMLAPQSMMAKGALAPTELKNPPLKTKITPFVDSSSQDMPKPCMGHRGSSPENRTLKETTIVQDQIAEYRSSMDSISEFLQEECAISFEHSCTATQLYTAYGAATQAKEAHEGRD